MHSTDESSTGRNVESLCVLLRAILRDEELGEASFAFVKLCLLWFVESLKEDGNKVESLEEGVENWNRRALLHFEGQAGKKGQSQVKLALRSPLLNDKAARIIPPPPPMPGHPQNEESDSRTKKASLLDQIRAHKNGSPEPAVVPCTTLPMPSVRRPVENVKASVVPPLPGALPVPPPIPNAPPPPPMPPVNASNVPSAVSGNVLNPWTPYVIPPVASSRFESAEHLSRSLLTTRIPPAFQSLYSNEDVMSRAARLIDESSFQKAYCHRIDRRSSYSDNSKSIWRRNSSVGASLLGTHRSTVVGIFLSKLTPSHIPDILSNLAAFEEARLGELIKCLPTAEEYQLLVKNANDALCSTDKWMLEAGKIGHLRLILGARKFELLLEKGHRPLMESLKASNSCIENIESCDALKMLLALLYRIYELANVRFAGHRQSVSSGPGIVAAVRMECLIKLTEDPANVFALHLIAERVPGLGRQLLRSFQMYGGGADLETINVEMAEMKTGMELLGSLDSAKRKDDLDNSAYEAFLEHFDRARIAQCYNELDTLFKSVSQRWVRVEQTYGMPLGECSPMKVVACINSIGKALVERELHIAPSIHEEQIAATQEDESQVSASPVDL